MRRRTPRSHNVVLAPLVDHQLAPLLRFSKEGQEESVAAKDPEESPQQLDESRSKLSEWSVAPQGAVRATHSPLVELAFTPKVGGVGDFFP